MMRMLAGTTISVLLCLCLPDVARCQVERLVFATPYPYKDYFYWDMRRDIESADLVFKGRAVDIKLLKTEKVPFGKGEDSVAIHSTFAATFKVDAAFKSEETLAEVEIRYVEASHSVDDAFWPVGLETGTYGLVFARKSETGYTLAKRAIIPITSTRVSHKKDSSPIARLRKEYVASLSDRSREIVLTAITVVPSLRNRSAAKPLKRFVASKDMELKGWALCSLITTGDYSGLKDAIDYVEGPSNDVVSRAIKSQICEEIWFVGTLWGEADEAVIRELQRWPTFRNRRLREAAREALQQIKKEGEFRGIPGTPTAIGRPRPKAP